MTFAPTSLLQLSNYYQDHGGVPLGIVGDEGHTSGYHLGRDRIFDGSGPGQGSSDYSVQLQRDINGLTNAASAIDLGRLDGSLTALYDLSEWLVRRCQAGAPGSRDVREIIYSPDGVHVQRYSGVDGLIHTGPGNGDDSHRTHTHVSYYRDSQDRDKVGLFAPYLEGDHVAVQAGITNEIPMLIHVRVGADLLELDGETKITDNAKDRIDVKSPYGRGSEDRSGVKWLRREFALDPDGPGPGRRRTVLVWIRETDARADVPPAQADLHRFVITVDAVDPLTVTRDAVPIE